MMPSLSALNTVYEHLDYVHMHWLLFTFNVIVSSNLLNKLQRLGLVCDRILRFFLILRP